MRLVSGSGGLCCSVGTDVTAECNELYIFGYVYSDIITLICNLEPPFIGMSTLWVGHCKDLLLLLASMYFKHMYDCTYRDVHWFPIGRSRYQCEGTNGVHPYRDVHWFPIGWISNRLRVSMSLSLGGLKVTYNINIGKHPNSQFRWLIHNYPILAEYKCLGDCE